MIVTEASSKRRPMKFGSANHLPVVAACAVAVAVLAAGCNRQPAAAPGKGARPALPSVAVKTAVAEVRPVDRSVVAFGSLAALDRATLGVKVGGRLESVSVDLGSRVKAGEIVAQLERPEYEAKLRQAEAFFAQAQARLGLSGNAMTTDIEQASVVKEAKAVMDEARRNLERVRKLAEQQIASEADLNSADAAYQVALNRAQDAREEARQRLAVLQQRRAELDIAKQQLIETGLRAPFDGVIEARLANPGELLAAGASVARIVRIDPLRLRLEVPERDAPKVKPNQSVRVTVEGDTNAYTGKLTRLSPVISDDSRMLMVEADVPNPGTLRPGQFARASIVTETEAPAVTVPTAAVRAFAGLEKVFVVKDGKADERTVTVGKRTTSWVEIVRGVAEGETVVLNPGGLQNQQPVTVEAAAKPARNSE